MGLIAGTSSRLLEEGISGLREAGKDFHRRGWSLGTSSNYSVLLNREPYQLLLTASGKDKGKLSELDFVILDAEGRATTASPEKPSAETGLHLAINQSLPWANAVLHTHSVWATLLSELHGDEGGFWIEGYEMLKGLDGIRTHDARLWVEIFPNTQDIPQLAGRVRERLIDQDRPLTHGFLIRKHGLYTWGRNLADARRHVEIFEFLFETTVRFRSLGRG
jgi:methylthioribulose-1-phosphate dehydratase